MFLHYWVYKNVNILTKCIYQIICLKCIKKITINKTIKNKLVYILKWKNKDHNYKYIYNKILVD